MVLRIRYSMNFLMASFVIQRNLSHLPEKIVIQGDSKYNAHIQYVACTDYKCPFPVDG